MIVRKRTLATLLVLVLLFQLAIPSLLRAADLYKPFKLLAEPFQAAHREKPATCQDDSIEELARQIDWLEHYIDKYGTIVAKHPDVWGQSRLMRHRYEYEERMAEKLGDFKVEMNAALRRSDQAFLGMAFAIQAAAGSKPGESTPIPPPTVANAQADLAIVSGLVPNPNASAPAGEMAVISRAAPGNLASGHLQGFSFEQQNLSLEPTIQLDQLSRYLNHLHELRRINEGDDIADSPGYSLNLVRIPVSVLPGKQTRKGYGAEITIIAEPYLGENLLPATFRNMVINDLVDTLAPVLTHIANDSEVQKSFEKSRGVLAVIADAFGEYVDMRIEKRRLLTLAEFREIGKDAAKGMVAAVGNAAGQFELNARGSAGAAARTRRARMPLPLSQVADIVGTKLLTCLAYDITSRFADSPISRPSITYVDVCAYLREELDAAYDSLCRDSSDGIWISFCDRRLVDAIRTQRLQFVDDQRGRFLAHLLLRNTPNPAGEFAVAKHSRHYGTNYSQNGQDQLEVIPPGEVIVPKRAENRTTDCSQPGLKSLVAVLLGEWACQESECESLSDSHPSFNICKTVTAALSWSILVEAALLNERLAEDMREASAAKGLACIPEQAGPFWGPHPSAEACRAFSEYVRCRWPIRVFALDPVTQDQNVADAFARRREQQVALAVAFAGGRINAQSMMRYARRLEWDMATINLNHTVVGFSHGNDTFGWRFHPRFQTPPIKGSIATFGETLFGGPTTDSDLAQRMLEPGMRECTAIIVMPSFVPYVTFDVRTNWFRLTDPKCTEMSMKDTLVLSRSIKSMQDSAAACSQCAHLYRDGEVHRLLRRVDQLDRELPMQTMQAQIPYENTSGGFELFNTGITDLAPELTGWYGSPGINPDAATTLYLIGEGFSVHGTRLIAGGQAITPVMISRQIIQVEIPAGVQTLPRAKKGEDTNELIVDVHMATPYGATSHLLIPVVRTDSHSRGRAVRWRCGAKLKLYVKVAKDNAVTCSEYFEAGSGGLGIELPALAPVPATPKLSISVHDRDVNVGCFTYTINQFDARSNAFCIVGNDLKLLVVGGTDKDGLQKYVIAYLKWLAEHDRAKLKASATLPLVVTAVFDPGNGGAAIPVGNSVALDIAIDVESDAVAAASVPPATTPAKK